MLDLRTILLPTDGSSCAERARSLARSLAERYGATLHVLHVDIVSATFGAEFDPLPDLDDVDVHADLRRPSEPATSADGGRTVEVRRQHPSPGHAIVTYAAETSADLVVMGTHGRGGFDRLVMGSTAEHVLRRAPCPVLTISSQAPPYEEDGPVLVPHDFSAPSDEALRIGADLARSWGTRLHMAHVVEEVILPSPYGISLDLLMSDELQARAGAVMEQHVDRVVPGPVPRTVEVRCGDAAEQILDVAQTERPLFLVQASAGRTGLRRLTVGSTAEAVARQAPCPVLTVKAKGRPLLRAGSDPLAMAEPVPRSAWSALFDQLSRDAQAREQSVSVEVVSPAVGDRVSVDERPLRGLSYDPRADRLDVLAEGVGHAITRPVAVRRLAAEGAQQNLIEVVLQDGSRELIAFHDA